MDKLNCTILIADDDKFIRDDLAHLLSESFERLIFAATAKETWEAVVKHNPDIVLLDIKFPDASDLSLLQRIKTEVRGLEVIILTSQTEDVAQIVSAIKIGAFDYVPKPFIGAELRNRIKKAINLQNLHRSNEHILKELEAKEGLPRLVGESECMRHTRDVVSRLAEGDGCVLIHGESGTGKEVAARAMHYLSRRRSSPFVAVNCAAIPESLVESVLFGHRKGAFTGAIESVKGKFELAGEGTLFLDEIGDMPLPQQASLLRVIEYRKYNSIGESAEKTCRARFILATNRDLKECIRQGKFRQDLYYRINVGNLLMPSLKDRPQDVSALIDYYCKILCAEMGRPLVKVPPEVMDLFQRYDWPGNVRELRNVLESVYMLIGPRREEITLKELPPEILALRGESGQSLDPAELREREQIIAALQQCNGNQSQAAKLLGIHRNTVLCRIRYFGITNPME